jgi:hypothetical protein
MNPPDKKRPHPPHMGEPKGITLEDRHCETLAGMKGWRPSAAQRLETGWGSFQADLILAGHRIDRPVFPLLGPRAHDPGDPWTPGFPFSRNKARGRQVGRRRRPIASHKDAIHDPKRMAPALRLPEKSGRPRNEDEKERQTTGVTANDISAEILFGSPATH